MYWFCSVCLVDAGLSSEGGYSFTSVWLGVGFGWWVYI